MGRIRPAEAVVADLQAEDLARSGAGDAGPMPILFAALCLVALASSSAAQK